MITLALTGGSVTYPATTAQLAGLASAHAAVTAKLPPGPTQDVSTPASQRPGYIADDVAYLTSVIQPWATAYPSGITTTTQGTNSSGQPVTITTTFAIPDMIGQTLNSWAGIGQTAPAPTTAPLTTAQTQAFLYAHADKIAASYSQPNGGPELTVTAVTLVAGAPAIYPLADVSNQGRTDLVMMLAGANNGVQQYWYQSNLPVDTTDPQGRRRIAVTAAQILTIGTAVGNIRGAVVSAWSQAYAGISAGTITTNAQIDVLAWPTVA